MPSFTFQTDAGAQTIDIAQLVVAGWTGRNAAAVQHHIEELAALGVPGPSSVPLYYRVGAELLTQASAISVLGPDTSGEVEPLIVADGNGALWLGLASDHTDRALEAHSVAKSKQACPKPIARDLWKFDPLRAHLDTLCLRADILEPGLAEYVRYQDGVLAALRSLPELMAGLPGGGLAPGTAMMCGTLTAMGGIRPATQFRMALLDPVQGREITCDYRIDDLPVIA